MLVALDQAADGDDGFDVAVLLQFRRGEDGVDRFLLRGVDEAAGIDEDDVGMLKVGGHDRPVADQVADEALGVDGRFITPQGDDAELHPR